MVIEQISVFAENKPGKLEEVLTVLFEHKINIKALSVADTSDFGIIRIIVDGPEKVRDILKEAGFTVRLTTVLAVAVGDKPGELLKYVKVLSAASINVEYTYAFSEPSTKESRVVLKVDNVETAAKLISTEK
jgi:hypothetical protein